MTDAVKLYVEKRRFFNDPKKDNLDGIVAMGDEWSVEILLEAYSFGIFPWPHEDLPCLWFCPDQRGVLDFSELKISKSLQKSYQKHSFQITYNKDFPSVIHACSHATRPGQTGTWVTPQLIKAYIDFHNAGYAHSIEAWENNELVGGVYGVFVGGVFSGESMFYKKSDASKICLLNLIEKLKLNGIHWMDIQMVTPLTEKLGGKYIPKMDYLARIQKAKLTAQPIRWDRSK